MGSNTTAKGCRQDMKLQGNATCYAAAFFGYVNFWNYYGCTTIRYVCTNTFKLSFVRVQHFFMPHVRRYIEFTDDALPPRLKCHYYCLVRGSDTWSHVITYFSKWRLTYANRARLDDSIIAVIVSSVFSRSLILHLGGRGKENSLYCNPLQFSWNLCENICKVYVLDT